MGLKALYLAKRVRCQLVGRDDPQISLDPPEFMLAPHSMTDVEYNLWGSGISYVGRLLEGWTMRSSTSLTLCLPLLLRYMFNLFFFSSLPCLSWLIMVENYSRRSLLSVSPLTLYISLGRSMLMALTVLLGSLSCPVILMSWAIFSLPTLGWWVLSLFANFFFFFLSLTFLSLNCSPLSKSIRSWYGWLGILSWRWPIIQGACTILEE